MTLETRKFVKEKSAWFRTGYIYTFRYKIDTVDNWTKKKIVLNNKAKLFVHDNEEVWDPEPTVLVINAIKGKHPVTGNIHNYLQGINFSYLPRTKRVQLLEDWKFFMIKFNGHVRIIWRYLFKPRPWLKMAIRRYSLGEGKITMATQIKMEMLNQHVVKKIINDYSRMAILSEIRKNPDFAKKLYVIDRPSTKFGGLIK